MANNTVEIKKNQQSGTSTALLLVFISGFVALIYQVLWMKQLGLLFGNTSQAASATLASFFAGLATGSWLIGKRVTYSKNPMRTYAWLEIGIAVTALLYFIILALFHSIYPAIYQSLGSGSILIIIKFILALILIFPPAFFMGGTIPVMGQFMIRQRNTFGKISALIYGINTLGAATGAALAGFYLPIWLGYNITCIIAISLSIVIAILAFRLSRHPIPAYSVDPSTSTKETDSKPVQPMSRQERRALERKPTKTKQTTTEDPAPTTTSTLKQKTLTALCFLSGFGILALEVLWTRMFSQVLENSVYTFAIILVVVLICLALGALASSFLSRLKAPPLFVITLLILSGAITIALTPTIFLSLTNQMELITTKETWSHYILIVFKTTFLTLAPSALTLGMIFPYLMKIEETTLKSPGLSLGRLATINTVGAILGASICGFLLLDWLGIWHSMQMIATLYLMLAISIPLNWKLKSVIAKATCIITLLLVITTPDFKNIPEIAKDPNNTLTTDEKVIETWEGSSCKVSVTESNLGKAIKINSDYSLGNTAAYISEKLQADLPLIIYPKTESLFFLGVGTGITAGSALDPKHQNIKKIVACELVPEVITAAKKYMTNINGFDTTGGLFTDPRADVLIEDGRHHLMATNDQFDMINADLFVPFRSGAGSLYTKEHFQNSKQRLTPNGVFVQWLPLYQLTENEFSTIARTMIEVFDQVSLWRHNFQPGHELVALIGHQKDQPLPPSSIDSLPYKRAAVRGKSHHDLMRLNLPLDPQTILLFYGGNLTASRSLFEKYPINTDDHPVIEYQAPRSHRSGTDTSSLWFVGEPLANLIDKIQTICPPAKDPLLINRTQTNRQLPIAGSAFHRARIEWIKNNPTATQKAWHKFLSNWLAQNK